MSRSRYVVGAACACTVALLAACLVTIDDSKIRQDASDSGADAFGEASVDARVDVLDGGCPSGMLAVPTPGDSGARYCIDTTEAALDQYAAFLATSEPPAAGTQPVECDWNTSYKPRDWSASSTGNRAVSGLDWCDARAYCKAAGKRLCGHLGGGPVAFFAGAANPSESEWANACTRGGTRTYPYGSTYDGQKCMGSDHAPAPQAPGPVGNASCVGGFDGLFDMSGNVGEFLDSCSTEKDPSCDGGHECELCVLIGGGFQDHDATLRCGYVNQLDRSGQYGDNGVRCCWP